MLEKHTPQISYKDESRWFHGMTEDYRQAVQDLATCLQGEVILPEDDEFEGARAVWNSAFDGHPALVLRCLSTDDVRVAVTFAREHALAVAVRSGGHDYSGHGTCNDGMVIDLSHMKGISIDPIRRIARIEPGLTWGEVAAATQPYGLALTSGDVASVGVGGLLLGGGIGMMVRKYGLTIDRVRAMELVTADGEVLRASVDEHADLFWGLRGGGGNFGIATAFEVELHPAGIVIGGAVIYDATEAEAILRAYAQYAVEAPEELSTIAFFMSAPPAPFIPLAKQGTPIVAIAVCYTGDLAEGERVVAPLRTLAQPIVDLIAPMPYPSIFALTQSASIHGLQHHARSLFLREVHGDMLHTLVEETRAIITDGTLLEIRILGGAMSRVSADATAFAHRDKQAVITITNSGPKAEDAEPIRARTERVWQALRPYADGAYVNFLGDEGAQRILEAYPPATYARLVSLKKRYDPTNLFHHNQNIAPI
jgi:FAD/FMN-containing dehydrogenase